MVLNCFQSGEVSPVGSFTIYFVILREVSGLRGGGGALEDTVVAPVGPRSNTQGNLGGRNIAGGDGKTVQEGQQIVNRTVSGEAGKQVSGAAGVDGGRT